MRYLAIPLILLELIARPVLAFDPADPLGIGEDSWLPTFGLPSGGAEGVVNIIIAVINLMLGLSAVLAVAAIIWGAVRIITSLGNQSGVESGKKIIFWAIVGLLIIGFSFAIIQLVGRALGVIK